MELVLRRYGYGSTTTTGQLTTSGAFLGFTLEPEEAAAIPCGRYRVTAYDSPRFKRTVLLLHDVPGFSYVEIHPGNFRRDTRGCILVGAAHAEASSGEPMVTRSEATFSALLARVLGTLRLAEVWISIEDGREVLNG